MPRNRNANDPFAAEIEREIAHRNSPAFILKGRAAVIVKAKDADIKDSEIASMAIKTVPGLSSAKQSEVLDAVREILKAAEEDRRDQVVALVHAHGAAYAADKDAEYQFPWLKGADKDAVAPGVAGLDSEDLLDLLNALTDFAGKNAPKKPQPK